MSTWRYKRWRIRAAWRWYWSDAPMVTTSELEWIAKSETNDRLAAYIKFLKLFEVQP